MEIPINAKDRKKRVKGSPDLSTLVYGKVPPQARDIEEAILGAIMLERNAVDTAGEILKPECFYVDSHQRIFDAIRSLRQKNMPIDILTVVEELRKRDELDIVGGAYYVTKLTNNVVSSAHIETHCKILVQKFIQRELIRLSGEVIGDAYEDSTDAFDLLDRAAGMFSALAINKISNPYMSLAEVSQESLRQIIEIKDKGIELTGIPSGLFELDNITQGFQPTNLIVIAARPSVGKSAVAGNLAFNAAASSIKPTPTAIFSLEMPSSQWSTRMMSAKSNIEMWRLKRGRIDDNDIQSLSKICFNEFPDIKVFFDDTPSMSIYQLKAKARVLVNQQKVGLIIVDYLQLMEGEGDSRKTNREQEVSTISRELKQLAKELNVPVIALSQLSRKGDGTDPQMSHLRESGAIEQNADDVFMLVEPPEDLIKTEPETYKDAIILRISKHRNGLKQDIVIRFIKGIQKIMNERDYQLYMQDNSLKAPTTHEAPSFDFDHGFDQDDLV